MKKITLLAISMLLILAVGIFTTMALFSDTETATGNTLTAGTLDLKVSSTQSPLGDDPDIVHIEVDNIYPGWSQTYTWTLKNVGTLSGKVSVTFSAIINNDNGLTEPESAVDSTGGDGEGELGAHLKAKPFLQYYTSERPLNAFSKYELIQHPVLGQNDEIVFTLTLTLPSDVGNIIQSDSVSFNIEFRLDQVV